MLHLARRIAFGVDVGNFLQLERAFERDGVVNAASEKQEILRAGVFLGQFFAFFFVGQQVFQLARNAGEFLDRALRLLVRSWCRAAAPRYSANRYSAVSCAVKALVEATPISGPAWV